MLLTLEVFQLPISGKEANESQKENISSVLSIQSIISKTILIVLLLLLFLISLILKSLNVSVNLYSLSLYTKKQFLLL